jgi:putative effector of murein hydrolase
LSTDVLRLLLLMPVVVALLLLLIALLLSSQEWKSLIKRSKPLVTLLRGYKNL